VDLGTAYTVMIVTDAMGVPIADVIYSVDEPIGGTHFSLVKAGANEISFEKAEEIKKDLMEQKKLLPVIRPVMEKVSSIINRNLNGYKPKSITLVGGTCIFPWITKVIEEVTGIRTFTPVRPMFVTPLGIALEDIQGLN